MAKKEKGKEVDNGCVQHAEKELEGTKLNGGGYRLVSQGVQWFNWKFVNKSWDFHVVKYVRINLFKTTYEEQK